MKASNVETAQRLVAKWNELKESYNKCDNSKENYLGITLQGKYQDGEFINHCRAAVLDELVRRIKNIESAMVELGLEIDL